MSVGAHFSVARHQYGTFPSWFSSYSRSRAHIFSHSPSKRSRTSSILKCVSTSSCTCTSHNGGGGGAGGVIHTQTSTPCPKYAACRRTSHSHTPHHTRTQPITKHKPLRTRAHTPSNWERAPSRPRAREPSSRDCARSARGPRPPRCAQRSPAEHRGDRERHGSEPRRVRFLCGRVGGQAHPPRAVAVAVAVAGSGSGGGGGGGE